jgi:mRNA-degrading endonuclease RelE of RelBE toxin-antitoxin system
MGKVPPIALSYADDVKEHLRSIDSKHHSLIRSEIEGQLFFEPDVETRNRKPLKRPISIGAQWELRFGPDNRFRVFYLVDADSRQVHILAVGVKDGNRLLIGGEEIAS